MKRAAPYTEANANQYGASQMEQMPAERTQHYSQINSFTRRQDSLSSEQGNRHISSHAEGQWQSDKDAPNVSNSVSSRLHAEGRGNAAQTRYQGRTLDAKVELEKQAKNDPRFQSYEEDMEVGYEDKPSVLTFEGLELKFQDEILKLVKEHSDAEDAETSRHREKIIEINTQYLEKLSLLRARQANRRDEYLCKETRVRLDQYQQAELRNHTAQTGPNDLCGYGEAAVSDRSRSYYDQHDSHREPPPFLGRGRGLGSEGRVPYPQGRVYNNAGARYR